MSRGTKCRYCMWWWDLHDTGERKCYNRMSKFFHKQTAPDHKCKDGCKLFYGNQKSELGYYGQKEKNAK